jgi:hypothetical protein
MLVLMLVLMLVYLVCTDGSVWYVSLSMNVLFCGT